MIFPPQLVPLPLFIRLADTTLRAPFAVQAVKTQKKKKKGKSQRRINCRSLKSHFLLPLPATAGGAETHRAVSLFQEGMIVTIELLVSYCWHMTHGGNKPWRFPPDSPIVLSWAQLFSKQHSNKYWNPFMLTNPSYRVRNWGIKRWKATVALHEPQKSVP